MGELLLFVIHSLQMNVNSKCKEGLEVPYLDTYHWLLGRKNHSWGNKTQFYVQQTLLQQWLYKINLRDLPLLLFSKNTHTGGLLKIYITFISTITDQPWSLSTEMFGQDKWSPNLLSLVRPSVPMLPSNLASSQYPPSRTKMKTEVQKL